MAIRTDEYNRVCVLTIDGDFSGDDTSDLRELVDGRAASGQRMELVIDMERCPYMDSAGLGELVSSGGSRAAAAVAPPGQRPEVVHAANVAFTSAFNEIILIAAIVSFVGAALGYLLVRSRDFVQPTEDAAGPAAA